VRQLDPLASRVLRVVAEVPALLSGDRSGLALHSPLAPASAQAPVRPIIDDNAPRLRRMRLTLPLLVSGVLGCGIGICGYTFVYAKGYSYLTNDPEACANCHIMREQFDGWTRSSHRAVAVCNDCHTPPGAVPKYVTKARNGFWHSFYFTTGTFPEPIQITPHNLRVTESACRKCHEEIVEAIDHDAPEVARLSCVACHRSVGHLH
jgi:cytochrome c nitrite reductase small subunit